MKVAIISEENSSMADLSNCVEITAERCEIFKTQAKDIEAVFIYGITNDRLHKSPGLSHFLKESSSKFLQVITEIV